MGDFFGTGMIVADFRQDGMTAWSREILVKMGVSWWEHAEHLTRYSVWAGSLFGVHSQEHRSDIVLPYSEWTGVGTRCGWEQG